MACANVNAKLEFQKLAEAWSFLRGMSKNDKRKVNLIRINLNDCVIYYSTLHKEKYRGIEKE